MRVLVIAGTVDARQIVEQLIQCKVSVTATVTTQMGKSLLKQHESVDIREGKLTFQEMMALMREIKACCLVDASHPFAKDASVNAMEACKRLSIPYLRYERPKTGDCGEWVMKVKDFNEAAERLKDWKGNIFLAIGSSQLAHFTKIPDYKKKIFARVLPNREVLHQCENLGLNAGNIIAMKGPFSEALNIEILKHCNASVMVTKDSGSAGGNEEKIRAARKLGISVIMIERPKVEYVSKVSTIHEIIHWIQQIKGGVKCENTKGNDSRHQ